MSAEGPPLDGRKWKLGEGTSGAPTWRVGEAAAGGAAVMLTKFETKSARVKGSRRAVRCGEV